MIRRCSSRQTGVVRARSIKMDSIALARGTELHLHPRAEFDHALRWDPEIV